MLYWQGKQFAEKGGEAMPVILIVEDDVGLSQGVALSLARPEYRFLQAATLAAAREAFAAHAVDLVLLDVGLPDGSGLTFCRELRAVSRVPILFLTANDAEYDEVAGFSAGGDDYITKPFRLSALRARVEAALRRAEGAEGARYAFGDLSFDFDALAFAKAGRPLTLSPTEQRLLRALVSRRGEPVPRETLLREAWDGGGYYDENTLTVAVRRLRAKLEDDPRSPRYLHTVYGGGYVWRAENG